MCITVVKDQRRLNLVKNRSLVTAHTCIGLLGSHWSRGVD